MSSVSIAARSTTSSQQTVAFAVALPSSSSFLFDCIACACECDASIEYDAYDST